MPDFDWRDTSTAPLGERFPDQCIGRVAWRQLVDQIAFPGAALTPGGLQQAFDAFMQQASVQATRVHIPECRVFVSHRQADVTQAERIVRLATHSGYGYWLDVHDPTLAYIGGALIPSPLKEVLTAAIIEMGLLNASHIIAAMTANSAGSKWIPYELGRAKHRLLHSVYSASWIHPGITDRDCGEYIYLAEITNTEPEITAWLKRTPSGYCSRPANVAWGRSEPPILPTTP